MNLIQGKIVDDEQARKLVPDLYGMLTETLAKGPAPAEKAIEACGKLIADIDRESVLKMLVSGGMSRTRAERELAEALAVMAPEVLEMRVRTELDVPQAAEEFRMYRKPLGTLFHIAAGNVDALPAYSVIEGLLAGNINILKLPGGADPVSVMLLKKLTELAPELAEYIYVFDFPSTDTEMLQRMADVSDAVVVWGGNEAVRAVRQLTPVNTKIIEWGHKLSFAYVTPAVTDEQLGGIAFNVCDANGLLCSSCQGVYVDTEDIEATEQIARRLYEMIENEYRKTEGCGLKIRAAKTVEMYTEAIEEAINGDRLVLRGNGCGVVVRHDSSLEASYGFGNIWVKCLPRNKIIEVLKKNKRFLQTVGLECGDGDRDVLAELLFTAGVDRITAGRDMSRMTPREPHDGRMSLGEYSRVVMMTEYRKG